MFSVLRLPSLVLAAGLCPAVPASAQFFVERAESAGLGAAFHTSGVAVADYDGDGDLDLFVIPARQFDDADPTTRSRLFRNEGGRFVDVTEASGINAARVSGFPVRPFGNRYAVAWGDYDRDGDPDVVLANVGPEFLLRNNGDGTFYDATAESGINPLGSEADSSETAGATWWDYDLDGDLDMYFSNWSGPNRLHRNRGDGTFEDVSVHAGVADSASTWSAMPIYANEDRWPDLYVVNDFGANRLYISNGDGTFRDETFSWRAGDKGDGMGIASGDVNGDGLLDLYITNIAFRKPNALLLSTGTHFEDVAEFLGVGDANWAWGTELFDADQDGDEDLYVVNGHRLEQGTPNRFWLSRLVETGRAGFMDRTHDSGANSVVEARGLVVFDGDGDGDQDMVVANWDAPVSFYDNRQASGHWLQIRLRGIASNTDGFGARLRLHARGRTQIRLHTGVDFAGQSSLPVHFGLGRASRVDSLVVTWPSGLVDRFFDVPVDQTLSVVEGSPHTGMRTDAPSVWTNSVTLFPSPADGPVQLLGLPPHADVDLFDLLGRRIPLPTNPRVLPHLPSGLYFVRITAEGTSLTRPLIYR